MKGPDLSEDLDMYMCFVYRPLDDDPFRDPISVTSKLVPSPFYGRFKPTKVLRIFNANIFFYIIILF